MTQPPASHQGGQPSPESPWGRPADGPASGQPYPGPASAPPYPGAPASGQPYPGAPASAQPYPGAPASAQPYPGAPASAQPAYPGQPGPATGVMPHMAPPEYDTAAQAWAAAPPPPKSMQWKRLLQLISLCAFVGLCGLALLIIVGVNIGPAALAVGVVSAVIPVPLLVYAFLWLDRYEPEPVKYLAFCFAWGACVATFVAFLVNTGVGILLERNDLPEHFVTVVCAPFIEEIMKFAGPLLLFWRRRRTFSGTIDSIVYCGLSATGFAFVENILYLGGLGYAQNAEEGGALGGAQGVVVLFFARILMSGFAHPLFTSMSAIGLGIAVRSPSRTVRILAPLAGLLAAMILHGAWNGMSVLVQTTEEPLIFLYGYFAVMIPIFLGMVGYSLWLRAAEGRLAERILPEYVRAGWLSPPEVATLGTIGRRLSARQWAKRVAGPEGVKAMNAYQFDLTRLALLRDGMHRGLGTAPNEINATIAEERRLLETIMAYRRVFIGRDPAAPQAMWDGHQYQVAFPDGVVRAVPAPEQPVVPVPVRLAPMAPPPIPGYGYPTYR